VYIGGQFLVGLLGFVYYIGCIPFLEVIVLFALDLLELAVFIGATCGGGIHTILEVFGGGLFLRSCVVILGGLLG